jgi:hypothetical protein
MLSSLHSQANIPPERLLLAQFLYKPASIPLPLQLAQQALEEDLVVFYLARLREQKFEVQSLPELASLLLAERQSLLQFMLQDHAFQTINTAFKAAKIQAIWLKGAVFAYTIYPEPSFRSKADLDLIVAPGDFARGLIILQEMGYKVSERLANTITAQLSHHAHLVHPKFPSIHVELHHSLLGYERFEQLSPESLANWLSQAVEFQCGEMSGFALKPEHQFLFHCAHGFLQHGEGMLGLRDYLDFHLFISYYPLDWEKLIQEAVELKWTFLVERALRRTQSYFGTRIPPDTFEKLIMSRPEGEDIDAIILKGSGDTRAEKLMRELRYLNFWEICCYLWMLALPSQSYMRERYNVKEGRTVLPYYLYRWFDQMRFLLYGILRRLIQRLASKLRKNN